MPQLVRILHRRLGSKRTKPRSTSRWDTLYTTKLIMYTIIHRYDFMGRRPLMTLWYAFNILATLFYGFCHQGGVYGAVNAISRLEMSPRAVEATIVFSNTYMPPKFPLLLAAAPGDRERRREFMWKHNMR